MALSANRGGPKPPMLSGPFREELGLTIGNARKFGIYERSRGTLARRVELPAWLYEGLQKGTVSLRNLRMPREEIGESRGQIFVSPPADLFDGPAVGLDMEIFDLLAANPGILLIEFHVYGNAYRAVDVWTITTAMFLTTAKFVQTKRSFMPQMMVPVSALSSTRPRSALH
jgi:hypothetical protein